MGKPGRPKGVKNGEGKIGSKKTYTNRMNAVQRAAYEAREKARQRAIHLPPCPRCKEYADNPVTKPHQHALGLSKANAFDDASNDYLVGVMPYEIIEGAQWFMCIDCGLLFDSSGNRNRGVGV